MDLLEQHVRQRVAVWIEEVQERSPEPGEIDQVTAAVTKLADDYIGTQVCYALS